MTLTMDSLCPHISQSKTRVLKSDMKTSYGITFPELKNGPKTKKVILFWLLFWVRRFGSFKRPPRRPKVAREGPNALPEGPWTPPGATQKGAQTAHQWPGGNDTSPPGRPDASGGRLGDIWDPRGSILG